MRLISVPSLQSLRDFQKDYHCELKDRFYPHLPHLSIMISCGLINLIGSGVITTYTAHTLL